MNILDNKNLTRTTTVIIKNRLRTTSKHTMMSGSGGGKKFGEELVKKCVGAGCASTRPFMQDNNIDAPKVPVHNNISVTPSSPTETVNQISTQTPNQITYSNNNQSKMKDISKPIESIADKVTINKTNSNSLSNTFPSVPMEPQKNFNIEQAIKTPLQQISNTKDNSFVTETCNIEKESSSVYDNDVVTNSSTKAKMQNVFHELTEKKKEQHEKYGLNDNDNIKPSAVKLKTFSNKEFETSLTSDTKVNDITDPKLIEELLKRELVKKYPANTAVKIKLQDNTEHLLGTAKNGIKLSALGQAYHEVYKSKKNNTEFPIDSIIKKEEIKFMLIVPPSSGNNCFIETGKQKHLLVGFDINTNQYISIGYLTSKTSGKWISELQYKNFENKQEKEIVEGIKHQDAVNTAVMNSKIKEKQQYFVPFDNANKISSNDVHPVKYSNEYMDTFSVETKKQLKQIIEEQLEKQIVPFDIEGLTKNDCLEMCKEFDKIALAKENNPKTKVQHPLSSEQEKINNKNAEKIINKNLYKSNNNKPQDEIPI